MLQSCRLEAFLLQIPLTQKAVLLSHSATSHYFGNFSADDTLELSSTEAMVIMRNSMVLANFGKGSSAKALELLNKDKTGSFKDNGIEQNETYDRL